MGEKSCHCVYLKDLLAVLSIINLHQHVMESLKSSTLPETNMAPERVHPLEKEIPIGNHHFLGEGKELFCCQFALPISVVNGGKNDDSESVVVCGSLPAPEMSSPVPTPTLAVAKRLPDTWRPSCSLAGSQGPNFGPSKLGGDQLINSSTPFWLLRFSLEKKTNTHQSPD